jgi:hypothetical protein
MKRRLSFAVVATAAVLAACGSGSSFLKPEPRTLRISTNQLLSRLGAQFPVKNRVMELADVVANNPRVRAAPAVAPSANATVQANNRLFTAVELSLTPTALAQLVTQRSLSGVLELSYGLRLEPSDSSVRLSDVKVENLKLDNLPSGWSKLMEQLGPRVTEQLLKDFTVYTFKPEDLKAAEGWGYKPSAVKVDGDGLLVTLEPIKR